MSDRTTTFSTQEIRVLALVWIVLGVLGVVAAIYVLPLMR